MRCLTCAVVTLLAAASAAAQAPVINAQRFAPLDAGNRWEYTLTTNAGAVVTGYVVATVDGETLVGGEPYVVVSRQAFGVDRAPTSARTVCAYSRTLGAAPDGSTSLPDYSCAGQPALPPPLPFTSGPTTVTPNADVAVSGQTVRVDSLLVFGGQGMGSGGAYSATAWTYATGLGYVSYRNWGQHHQGAGGGTYDTRTTLTFARVAGTVVGTSAVAGETAPPEAQVFALLPAPNPFADAVRIATVGAAGQVTLDVFDALGRHVERGTASAATPFTFRAPAAGVYVVRARDEAGHTAVQRVVRR